MELVDGVTGLSGFGFVSVTVHCGRCPQRRPSSGLGRLVGQLSFLGVFGVVLGGLTFQCRRVSVGESS